MGRVAWGLGLGWMALSGCNNACQNICRPMASYAEECGFTVADAELDACIERMAGAESEDLKACRQFGDPETIRQQWTCDEVASYWTPEEG